MKNKCNMVFVTVCTALMAACGLPGSKPSAARHAYMLLAEPQPAASSSVPAKPCMSLRVSVPGSAPGFATSQMAYIRTAQRLEYFAFHEWVDTPARMLAAMMESRLDSSALFGAVVSGSADIRTDLRLDADIARLLQDFTGGGSNLELTIKVKLVDISNRTLLNARTFNYVETAAGADPESGVAAAQKAATRFLLELQEFVSRSVEAVDCPSTD